MSKELLEAITSKNISDVTRLCMELLLETPQIFYEVNYLGETNFETTFDFLVAKKLVGLIGLFPPFIIVKFRESKSGRDELIYNMLKSEINNLIKSDDPISHFKSANIQCAQKYYITKPDTPCDYINILFQYQKAIKQNPDIIKRILSNINQNLDTEKIDLISLNVRDIENYWLCYSEAPNIDIYYLAIVKAILDFPEIEEIINNGEKSFSHPFISSLRNQYDEAFKNCVNLILKNDKYAFNALLSKLNTDKIARLSDELGFTLLHYAAASGNEEIFNLLLNKAPALMDKIANNGVNVLHLAYNNPAIAETIINSKFEFIFGQDDLGQSPAFLVKNEGAEKTLGIIWKSFGDNMAKMLSRVELEVDRLENHIYTFRHDNHEINKLFEKTQNMLFELRNVKKKIDLIFAKDSIENIDSTVLAGENALGE